MKVVIIGAIAGGATIASQIRRAVPTSEIHLFGRERQIGYGTCGLPYVVGGMIDEKRKVGGPSPQKFADSRDIHVHTLHEVVAIHRETKTIDVKNIETGELFSETYDKLILSTGTKARVPNFPGQSSIPLFTLKNYADMETVLQFLDEQKPTSCAVIGGGFVGVEVAENLVHRGMKTTLISRGERVMNMMDPEISERLHNELEQNGVQLILQDEIERIDGSLLYLKGGDTVEADFIMASIGASIENSLAVEAGLPIGTTQGVIVNEFMQTEDPHIYVIGDAAECTDAITGKPKNVQLAWHAHRQSYVVARHLAGNPIALNGLFGTTIIKVFSQTAAMTGLSKEQLDKQDIAYETATYEGRTNAGYYPDCGHLYMHVHYDPTTRKILGAHAVGTKGVDKRIDVLATAMLGNLTIDDLAAIELAYSPPYSSPKDPVNMIGYKAK